MSAQVWRLSCPVCGSVTEGTLAELRALGGGMIRCQCKAEKVRLPDLVGQAEDRAPLAASKGDGSQPPAPAPEAAGGRP